MKITKKFSNRTKRKYTTRPWVKHTARIVLLTMLAQICFPTVSWALTSGPQQPEATNFTPADVSNLVDPFTGDFSYNIPMFDIGGYPINLSYNSGVSMDQEASWTGLGWNLNTGAITRDVRGLPDDFWGDEIVRTVNTKKNITAGGSVTVGAELIGIPLTASYGLQIKYNNYSGFHVGQTMRGGTNFETGANISLGLSTTNGGLDINPSVSFSDNLGKKANTNYKGSLGFGLNINSRTGLSQMSLNASVSGSQKNGGTTNSYKNKQGKDETRAKDDGASFSAGGSISFLDPTFIPQNPLPYQNYNFSGSFQIGGAVFFGDINGTIGGFYSEQSLMKNTVKNPGYGYMYSEKGQNIDNATHDFNREKDGAFTKNTPSLPLTNYTYDAFNIKAQGIGGSFRAFRNDVGHVFDPGMMNPSVGGSFGLEVELGNAVDFGIDVNVNWNESKTGRWNNSNPAKSQLTFGEKQVNTLAENVFFKLVGEKTAETDHTFTNTIQHDKAVAVNLENKNDPMTLNQLKSDQPSQTTNLNNNNKRTTRLIRNTLVQCFTVSEVKRAFPIYVKYMPSYVKDHHIGMIIVTSPDGTRYVFGLPAYNRVKKEVTMAVGGDINGNPGLANDPATNLVSYGSAEASIGNKRGIDNYYDQTETPAFIHTWYLTEVLSPDYSDIGGDGPTLDDLGGYIKFSYGIQNPNGSVSPNITNYKWRTPSSGSAYKATYSKGLETVTTDDKATYLYGEKDIWYPNTMESKTQIVKFQYSDRRDGFGVTGEHGGTGGDPQKKIDRIDIYSLNDYYTGGMVPLKSIHFEYDYSLCANVWNNNGASEILNGLEINGKKGKLTLKKVYFTYRNSAKAKYSAYEFTYPTSVTGNPDYDPTANDRWGAYRKNGSVAGIPRNEDFPYTYQDKTKADEASECWNLTDIQLPTGGRIHMDYESDDYGYVQDRKACRMFQVTGAASGNSSTPTTNLYTRTSGPVITNYNYLIFNLETPVSAPSLTDADRIIKETYFDDPDEPEPKGPSKFLYFRFLTNVNNGNESPANEYVSGYADVDIDQDRGTYCGVYTPSLSGGQYTKGWVKLKETPRGGGGSPGYQPIAQAGWAFSRINTPFYANNMPTPGQSDPGDFLKTILNASIIGQMIDFFKGPNKKLESKGFSSKFVPQNSWIRMYDPNNTKYGGGHRVKRITILDNWNKMENDEESFQYGQEFAYDLEDGSSSGVASYEPMYGADENPFRTPVFYDKEYGPLIPDDRFYQEEPFGETFFPSPSVGYSRVKIMNLQRPNVTKTATGNIIKEFYTAKDFPTITHRTDMNVRRSKIDPLLAIFSPYVFDFMTASQGFVIELNDMHGKSKKESVYQEGNEQEPISSIEYFYQQESYDETQVNNKVPVMLKDGSTAEKEIGTEIDMVSDFRESANFSGNVDIGFNTDYAQMGPLPLIILAVFPKLKFEDTRFRSASVTKVVNRYGIQSHTKAMDLGSQVNTENKLYNDISGEVISTQVNNEYEDDRYTLSVPAYWAYPGMAHASNNAGFEMRSTEGNWNGNTGTINPNGPGKYFHPGDEVLRSGYAVGRKLTGYLNTPTNYTLARLWVAQDENDSMYFIDQYGQPFTDPNPAQDYIFTVIRSGHRNILSPKISEFATLNPPVNNFTAGSFNISNSSKVLSVSAQTFHEQWKKLKRYDCETPTLCICEEEEWAVYYASLIGYAIEHHLVFDDMVGTSNGNLFMGHLPGLANGMSLAFLDFLLSVTDCELNDNSYLYLTQAGSSAAPWDPATDLAFLNGTPRSFRLTFYTDGNPCTECTRYTATVINPEEVPAGYYTNFNCNDTISGMPPDHVIYVPVTIGGESKMIALANPGGIPTCGDLRNCKTFGITSHDNTNNAGSVINPYIFNVLGQWRAHEAYTLIQDRTGDVNTSPNLRDQGYIDGYSKFWEISGGLWQQYASYDQVHWKKTTTMTQYHPSGPQIEEKNALNIYSAAQYGYYEQLVVAVAQNAAYKEIGYDGFEDYTYLDGVNSFDDCKLDHFKFAVTENNIVTNHAHTGRYSLLVTDHASMKRDLQDSTAFRNTRDVPYTLINADFTEFFGPLKNQPFEQKFIFSFWVKQADYTPVTFDYTAASGDIQINSTSLITSVKKSPIIDKWQKFEYTFVIPPNSTLPIIVSLATSGANCYFDDVRIHPYSSMMKTYVYDPSDLRFMAELDENNFATFYEYDEDGALVRVKKETERGVMTIQENRYRSFKNQ